MALLLPSGSLNRVPKTQGYSQKGPKVQPREAPEVHGPARLPLLSSWPCLSCPRWITLTASSTRLISLWEFIFVYMKPKRILNILCLLRFEGEYRRPSTLRVSTTGGA